jgi:hypothetical protein
MVPSSIIAGAMAARLKEAAGKAVKDVYDGLSAGSMRLVATNLDSTILGARIAISHLNRVTVFMGIITDAGIPTDRAGFNCRINDILKDLAEPIPPPELESPPD